MGGLESAAGFLTCKPRRKGAPFTPKPLAKTPRRGTPRTTKFDGLSPLVRRGRIFHVELSEKADVAAAIVRSAHLLPVECLGDAVPSTEDASPVPSGQVQINTVGLTGAYFGGPASPSSSARPHNHAWHPLSGIKKINTRNFNNPALLQGWVIPPCFMIKDE